VPRYRFTWENFPPQLLSNISAAVGLIGAPLDELRKRYGARPRPDFIRDAWTSLLADWLPQDDGSRKAVVAGLRAAGLGDTDKAGPNAQAELDYIKTCRNSGTLREIVLAAFLEAGEPNPAVATPSVQTTAAAAPALSASQTSPSDDARTEGPPAAPPGDTADDLRTWVEAVLKAKYGWAAVKYDKDGDIPVQAGSAAVYIQFPKDGRPFLEIFSIVLWDFEMTTEIYEAVNVINAREPMMKAVAFAESKQIVFAALLLIDSLTAKELDFTLNLVVSSADYYDTLLQKRFGGKTQFGDGVTIDV